MKITEQLKELQDEMNTLCQSLKSKGIFTRQVYNRLCSEYAVKFTKLLAANGIKQSVSFALTSDVRPSLFSQPRIHHGLADDCELKFAIRNL